MKTFHSLLAVLLAVLVTTAIHSYGAPPPPPPKPRPAPVAPPPPPGGATLTKLLPEFRPIGGTGNNLVNPDLDPVPGTPELAIAPLNFAAGADDPLVDAPNPRTISNVIAGGTGANGQDADTTDPHASAWLYVF